MKRGKKIDENEFFREAALRICGTFEIEKALWYENKIKELT